MHKNKTEDQVGEHERFMPFFGGGQNRQPQLPKNEASHMWRLALSPRAPKNDPSLGAETKARINVAVSALGWLAVLWYIVYIVV